MAKWLNKYFSLGNNNNNKSKSPPQPPRPDYKRNGGTERSFHLQYPGGQQQFYKHHTSPLPGHCREESDLIRAYRAQKDRDFEDPYNGPGSSLRKLRAMCREEQQGEGRRGCTDGTNCFLQESYHGGGSSTNTTSSSSSSSSSPHLYRSNSERRPAGAKQQLTGGSEHKYMVSPKHRLIKIDSCGWGENGTGGGGAGTVGITWSPVVTPVTNKTEEQGNPGAKKEKVIIADDYSDPFDAKSEQKIKGIKTENNGYMEPYEAQRLMTDIQKNESQKSLQKNIQLYDTPYEPESNGVESDSESIVGLKLRESKLPQDDDRPADEYDQPWEWNKALPALAAQFNGGEKMQSLSPSNDRRRQLRAPGGGFKPIKHGSPDVCGILGERVDPNIALEKQIWYHGAISRTDAENLLRLCKECSYLVRNSQTSKHDFSLSLKSSQGFMHMKLSKTKEKYILGQNSPPFESVPEVVHFYTTRKLPIKGAEHLSLLYPVPVRTL